MKQTPITRSAKGEACTIRLPTICNGNPETTVFSHISGIRFGHGTGQKVNDLLGAYGCSCCHDVVDGRVKHSFDADFVKLAFYEGVFETQLKLIKKGLITL
jgi:hypothetical protein